MTGRQGTTLALGGLLLAGAWAGLLTPAARADLPVDKTPLIQDYASESLQLTLSATSGYEVRQAGKVLSDPDWTRVVKDPDLIGQADAASFRRRLLQSVVAGLAIPIGSFVLYDDFLGRPTPQFSHPTLVAPYPAADPRSFLLAAGGALLAYYGATQAWALASELLGLSHPNDLDPEDVKGAIADYDRNLRDELGLTLADVRQASGSSMPTGATPAQPVLPAGVPAGVPGSAAYALRPAIQAVQEFKGSGYQPYLLMTKDLTDYSGIVPSGGTWDVLFYAPTTNDDIQVAVTRDGGTPAISPAPTGYTAYRAITGWLDNFKQDSPAAMVVLGQALKNQGIAFYPRGSAMVLYPRYGLFTDPIWTVQLTSNPGQPTFGADGRTAALVNMTLGQTGLPGGVSAPPANPLPPSGQQPQP